MLYYRYVYYLLYIILMIMLQLYFPWTIQTQRRRFNINRLTWLYQLTNLEYEYFQHLSRIIITSVPRRWKMIFSRNCLNSESIDNDPLNLDHRIRARSFHFRIERRSTELKLQIQKPKSTRIRISRGGAIDFRRRDCSPFHGR